MIGQFLTLKHFRLCWVQPAERRRDGRSAFLA
jgi:hypothetical protein